jgi:hypothetical protein
MTPGKGSVVISGPLYLNIVSDTDSIELPSDSHIVFDGVGSIKYDNIIVPTFFTNGANNVIIDDALVYYSGHMTALAPWTIAPYNAYFSGFYDNVLERTDPDASQIPGTSTATCFFFCGGSNIQVNRPRFIATGSTSDDFFPNCIVAIDGNDAAPITEVTIRSPFFDGCIMSILAWRIDGLNVTDVMSKRYGAFNSTWAPPPHVVYVSPNFGTVRGSKNVMISGFYDYGTDASNTDAGQLSLKVSDVDGVRVSDVYSARPHGMMDISARSGTVSNVFWSGVYAKTLAGGIRPFRFINPNGVPQENARLLISGLYLEVSDQITDSMISAPSSTADQVANVTMKNVTLRGPSVASSSSPLIAGGFSDCVFEVDYLIGTGPDFTILLRIDAAGTRNRLTALLNGLDLATVRVLENPTSSGSFNSATVIDAPTGTVRQIAI